MPLFNFSLTAAQIKEKSASLIAEQLKAYTEVIDYVNSLQSSTTKSTESTTNDDTALKHFQLTFEKLATADGIAATGAANCTLPSMVSQDSAVRLASSQARSELQSAFETLKARKDVFNALSYIVSNYISSSESSSGDNSAAYDSSGKLVLSEQQRKLVELTMKQFKLTGSDLPTDKQSELKQLKSQLASACTLFEQRINEDTSGTWLTKEELAGVPSSFLSRLKVKKSEKDESADLYWVGMKAPELIPVLNSADLEETRKRAYMCSITRCSDNEATLKEILLLRSQIAQLLNYSCYPELVFATKMADSIGQVAQFLLDIAQRLYTTFEKDIDVLTRLKLDSSFSSSSSSSSFSSSFSSSSSTTTASIIMPWDVSYYSKKRLDKEFGINDEQIRQYFPLEHIVDATMKIYSETLGLIFKPVDPVNNEIGSVWHSDVTAYSVFDSESQELLGYFYLDLFPRDGKYSHQCIYPISPSFSYVSDVDQTKKHQYPVCALLGNMTKPTPTLPSLLQFSEVLTFFHEFGHIVHCVCTQVNYPRLSWSWSVVPWEGGVETDFLEAPSQMLENWLYDSQVLKRLSKHTTLNEPLPDSLISALIKSRNLNESVRYERQIFMSLYDLLIHCQNGSNTYSPNILDTVFLQQQQQSSPTSAQTRSQVVPTSVTSVDMKKLEEMATAKGNLSISQLWSTLQSRFMGYPTFEGTFYPSTWYHMTTYASTYYSYLYSSVFSFDMFSLFKSAKNGCFDKEQGNNYKIEILRPGASRSGLDMLKRFLGRDPSTEAFTKEVINSSDE